MIGNIGWMDRAICAALGGPRWDTLSPQQQRRLCSGCPVRAECLAWNLGQEQPPRHGVVGGLVPAQRRGLAHKIGRR